MFVEFVIVVSIGSLFAKRSDLRFMSKNSGYFIGKTIGRLQGVRIQMEQQSKQNDVYKLHGSIRQGLQSARGIAYDLSNIVSPINNGASILAQKKAFDKKKSEDDAISASTNLSNLNKDVNINDEIKEEELHRLARLAIAEKEMAKMSGMNGNEIDQTGSDFIQTAITESIILESFTKSVDKYK